MDPPHTHNRPLSSGKGAHHEGGIRVPLLVRWPGKTQAAGVNETPVTIYDWFPTLLKVAGSETDTAVRDPNDPAGKSARLNTDGLDLTPLLSGAKAPATFDRPLIWHFPNFWGPLSAPSPVEGPGLGPSSAIRKGEWKLIYYHGDEHFELFNLANDLGEMTNLAAQKPECVRELAAELAKILRQNQAPMPVVKATGKPVPYPNEIRP
jgi:arylsulfatase A-like enzyme